jgi:acetyltransferase-like isoleucine patch superfamily enzyme
VSIGRRARLQCLVGSGEPAAAGRIHFGDRASLEDGCHVGALGPVVIGDDVLIASHVLLLDHGHEYDDPSVPISRQPLRGGGLTIGEGSHIGEGACVLGPVAVGRHSVIGAGAVVVRDVPDLTVVGGVPARPLKRYDADVGRWVPA